MFSYNFRDQDFGAWFLYSWMKKIVSLGLWIFKWCFIFSQKYLTHALGQHRSLTFSKSSPTFSKPLFKKTFFALLKFLRLKSGFPTYLSLKQFNRRSNTDINIIPNVILMSTYFYYCRWCQDETLYFIATDFMISICLFLLH